MEVKFYDKVEDSRGSGKEEGLCLSYKRLN